jgi:hypothetical protein
MNHTKGTERLKRLVDHLRKEPKESLVMTFFFWRGDKYLGEDNAAAPAVMSEFFDVPELVMIQGSMLRHCLQGRGADAYVVAAEVRDQGVAFLYSEPKYSIVQAFRIEKTEQGVILKERFNLNRGTSDAFFTVFGDAFLRPDPSLN